MNEHLPSREWRIFILTVALVASVGVYVNAEFGAAMTRQAKAEAAAARLLADRTAWAGDLKAVRSGLLADAVLQPEGEACLPKAAEVRRAERKALENIVGAPFTGPNVFGFCMKGYYGAETACISWLNERERASIIAYDDAWDRCSAR